MPRVFMPLHDGRYNTEDARRYGEIVRMPISEVYPDEAGNIDASMTQLRGYLESFDPDSDFLVLTGSPMAVAMCTFIIGQRRWRKLQVLKYDKLERAYYRVTLRGIIEEEGR